MELTLPRAPAIDDGEFRALRTWIHEQAGIHLSDQKKALVMGRLGARLRHHGLARFRDYYELLKSREHPREWQIAVDLLTTNETYFFREPKHFDFLRDRIVPEHKTGRPLRVWSAACSSGEEPYSAGMTLASSPLESRWEIVASDLSTRVLDRARNAVYAIERSRHIPRELLQAHCYKGVDRHAGTFMVAPHIARQVQFLQVNLNRPLPDLGTFDVVFLRNVMIYFDGPTKQQVIERVLGCLRPGGWLLIGHSESLTNVRSGAQMVAPATYRKPGKP